MSKGNSLLHLVSSFRVRWVAFPGKIIDPPLSDSSEYLVDVTHPAGFFNRANATCVIEPGTNEDTAIIVSSIA